MRLLVTNDDGVESAFLRALVGGLRAAGHEPFVVAPKREQSWVGAGKSRYRAVHAVHAERGLECPTWVVDGTPADCVNIALAHLLDFSPDAVVSGINIGLNASLPLIVASGTVAGAWEGALHGLPAIALSQELPRETFDRLRAEGGGPDEALAETLRVSAAHAARLIPDLIAAPVPRSFCVHNLNFPYPCRAESALCRTVPARVLLPKLFTAGAEDGTHRFVFHLGEDVSPPEPLSDRAALRMGQISHSVLDYSRLGSV